MTRAEKRKRARQRKVDMIARMTDIFAMVKVVKKLAEGEKSEEKN